MGNDIMKLLFDVMKLMTKYNQLKIAVSVTFFIACNHPISELSLILTWWPKSTRVTQCYPGTLAHSVCVMKYYFDTLPYNVSVSINI